MCVLSPIVIECQGLAVRRPRAEVYACILQQGHTPQRRSIPVRHPDLLASTPIRGKRHLAAIRREASGHVDARGVAKRRVCSDRRALTWRLQIDQAKTNV